MTKNILVIYTGGTIGMRAQQGSDALSPDPNFMQILRGQLDAAQEKSSLQALTVHLVAIEPAIDSAEANPGDWWRIARFIEQRSDAFDGFVVLHGTDTLCFCASAVSFALAPSKKHVVFTGSQRPMCAVNTDAHANLHQALFHCISEAPTGVYIAFAGRVMWANRAYKSSSQHDAAFETNGFDGQASSLKALPGVPQQLQHEPLVSLLYWTPAYDARCLQTLLAQHPYALLLCCYGSGNLSSFKGTTLNALKLAAQQDVMVAIVSQCRHGGIKLGQYFSSELLVEAGAMSAGEMTLEAAYAKLHWLAALRKSSSYSRNLFEFNVAGERSGNKLIRC
jgi:L-asparaginase